MLLVILLIIAAVVYFVVIEGDDAGTDVTPSPAEETTSMWHEEPLPLIFRAA